MSVNLFDLSLPFIPEYDAFILVEGDLDEYVESRRTVVERPGPGWPAHENKQVAGIDRRLAAGLQSFLSRGFSPVETLDFDMSDGDDGQVWTVAMSASGAWSRRSWIVAYCGDLWVAAVSTRNRERGEEPEYTVWAGSTPLPSRYRERFLWRKAIDVARRWSLCEHEAYPARCFYCRGQYEDGKHVAMPYSPWAQSAQSGDSEEYEWDTLHGAVVAHWDSPYGEVWLSDDGDGRAWLRIPIEGRDELVAQWAPWPSRFNPSDGIEIWGRAE